MQNLPLLIVLLAAAVAVLAAVVAILALRGKRKPAKAPPLPTEWALTARPVFSSDERRAYRQLREALPHHIILSKLPLLRFCQPADPNEGQYWYNLLGATYVTFALCSANGRVLAAIDLDDDRGGSRRTRQVKQHVLNACRVRYLRCPFDHLPTAAELQLLVPGSGAAARGPQPAPRHPLHLARDALSSTVAHRRAERTALWQDSALFQDSFFAPGERFDPFASSEFGSLHTPGGANGAPRGGAGAGRGEIAGVVVDAPGEPGPDTRH